MRYLIDTNVFVRVVIKDEEKAFRECFKLLESVKKGKIAAFSPHLVLAEIYWTLKTVYRLTKEEAIEVIRGITNLKGLKINGKPQILIALDIFERLDIKFIDALISSIPEVYAKKATIISYDKDFDKIGVLRREPAELV